MPVVNDGWIWTPGDGWVPVLVATLLVDRGVEMGRRGRKRQLDVETEYWRLLKSSVGTVAASRPVGITRKTGYRWLRMGGVPPVRLAEEAGTSRYLSLLERQRIATLRGRDLGVREIARLIARAPSPVRWRDLRPHDRDRYDGDLARPAPGSEPGDDGTPG